MRLIITLLLVLCSLVSTSQTLIIQNGTHLIIENGTNLITRSNTSPFVKIGSSGGILTKTENSKVIVEASNSTGVFSIPFESSFGSTIPFEYNITTSGVGSGKILFCTYETGVDNLPYPSGVTQLNHNSFDNSEFVIDRFWIIDPIGYTQKPEGQYTFTYDDNDLIGNSIDESFLFAQRWNDIDSSWGDWLYSPNVNISSNRLTLSIQNSQDQFKVWTLVDQGSPLPIELFSFYSDCEERKLKWSTASETNNQWFVIQGTEDGIQYIDIDTINGAGFSNSILNYEYSLSENSFSYYRLKQIDFDGSSENSFLIAGCKKKDLPFVLFPNPSQGKFTIIFEDLNRISIIDLLGREIRSIQTNQNQFDVSDLSEGEYIIRATNPYQTKIFKFIKID